MSMCKGECSSFLYGLAMHLMQIRIYDLPFISVIDSKLILLLTSSVCMKVQLNL